MNSKPGEDANSNSENLPDALIRLFGLDWSSAQVYKDGDNLVARAWRDERHYSDHFHGTGHASDDPKKGKYLYIISLAQTERIIISPDLVVSKEVEDNTTGNVEKSIINMPKEAVRAVLEAHEESMKKGSPLRERERDYPPKEFVRTTRALVERILAGQEPVDLEKYRIVPAAEKPFRPLKTGDGFQAYYAAAAAELIRSECAMGEQGTVAENTYLRLLEEGKELRHENAREGFFKYLLRTASERGKYLCVVPRYGMSPPIVFTSEAFSEFSRWHATRGATFYFIEEKHLHPECLE